MSAKNKKEGVIKIDSDDTEGSDLSYESSFDDKAENQQEENPQQNLVLFKEQMVRFLLTHPELQQEINFEKLDYEDDRFWGYKPNKMNKKYISQTSNTNNLQNQLQEKQELELDQLNEQAPDEIAKNPILQSMAKNLIQESKSNSSIPSIESFTQRLNLFRRKVEKPDIIDIIIKNRETLYKQIEKEEERKAKLQNRIHKTIEAKLRKETGDVAYYSLRKKYEFQFRMKQEENRQKLKQESNNQNKQQQQQQSSLQQQYESNQNYQRDGSNKKKKTKVMSVFERLRGKQLEDDTEKEIPLDMEFKTAKGEQLYRLLQKKDNEEEKKRTVIQFLMDHREKTRQEFDGKHSLLSQGQKYYSEESKEFSLLAPSQHVKQQMAESGIINDEFFDHRADLEDGNTYLLTKVNKILNGNLMKKWKNIQDQQF